MQIVEPHKKKEVSRKKRLPKYDVLAAPLTIFDWENSGVLFKMENVGAKDAPIIARFETLIEQGYTIVDFFQKENKVYFLFYRYDK